MDTIKIEIRSVKLTNKLLSQIRKVNYSTLVELLGKNVDFSQVRHVDFHEAIGWIHPTVLNKKDHSNTGWLLFRHPETKEYLLYNAMMKTVRASNVPQIYVL